MFKNMFNFKRKNECGLLPHTRENIHGLYGSMQFYPWPIKLLDVEKVWNKTMGENVTVGVLDTGCDSSHDDLKDNLLQGWNAIKNNANDLDIE